MNSEKLHRANDLISELWGDPSKMNRMMEDEALVFRLKYLEPELDVPRNPQIGRDLGLTRSRVHQLEEDGMRALSRLPRNIQRIHMKHGAPRRSYQTTILDSEAI